MQEEQRAKLAGGDQAPQRDVLRIEPAHEADLDTGRSRRCSASTIRSEDSTSGVSGFSQKIATAGLEGRQEHGLVERAGCRDQDRVEVVPLRWRPGCRSGPTRRGRARPQPRRGPDPARRSRPPRAADAPGDPRDVVAAHHARPRRRPPGDPCRPCSRLLRSPSVDSSACRRREDVLPCPRRDRQRHVRVDR